jgi:hypothetical protein
MQLTGHPDIAMLIVDVICSLRKLVWIGRDECNRDRQKREAWIKHNEDDFFFSNSRSENNI